MSRTTRRVIQHPFPVSRWTDVAEPTRRREAHARGDATPGSSWRGCYSHQVLCVKVFLQRGHARLSRARDGLLDSEIPEHLISPHHPTIQGALLRIPRERPSPRWRSSSCDAAAAAASASLDPPAAGIPRFDLPRSGLELERPTRPGAFFDVVGRRSAVFGYENRPFEAWAYPLKLVDDFKLAFRLEGYPLEFDGARHPAAVDRAAGGHDLHLLARRLHGARDRLRARGRAGDRDAPRRPQHAALDRDRLLPPAPPARCGRRA